MRFITLLIAYQINDTKIKARNKGGGVNNFKNESIFPCSLPFIFQRVARGYQISLLYYEVKEYDIAKRYNGLTYLLIPK